MKANELMIGDWVCLYGDPQACGRVIELHADELLITMKGDAACDIWGYEDTSPIPLTAEILEKNGFEVSRDGGKPRVARANISDFYIAEYHFSLRQLMFVTMDGVTKITLQGMHYVHLYQRALRLCGLNDLADNFKID